MMMNRLVTTARTQRRGLVRHVSDIAKPTPHPSNPPQDAPAASARKSIAPEGTVMKGLSFFKGKEAPVVRPDAEYPNWLWDLTTDAKAAQDSTIASRSEASSPSTTNTARFRQVVYAGTSRADLRRKNREEIKSTNFLKTS